MWWVGGVFVRGGGVGEFWGGEDAPDVLLPVVCWVGSGGQPIRHI